MAEKLFDFEINHPLTAERRETMDRFIAANAGRLGRPVSHRWDDAGNVLRVASDPVEWVFTFYPDRLEVFGTAPFWIKMLFTEKLRAVAHQTIRDMLAEAGLIDAPDPGKK
ncbi:MAG TPA: hypothetical protein VHY22_19105 [Chthoniobacteraceae bacterium]|jgi:hypothetical protein|nr:hypothetical protein [Chthoniobacteraceae bacterium]